jgi:hypothetical protein
MHHAVTSSATLRSSGRSTRLKSVTLFLTTLVLAMLAGSVAAQAQAPTLVVTAIDAGRFYGDPNPAFTANITGLNSGDNITVTFTTPANTTSAAGTYQIVPTLVDPDGKLANYVVVVNSGTLTVTPAPLIIIADDMTRSAGSPNPTFTGSVQGLKNGDAITATQDSSATVDSPAGSYTIVPTLQDASGNIGNYSVSISNGTLTITP